MRLSGWTDLSMAFSVGNGANIIMASSSPRCNFSTVKPNGTTVPARLSFTPWVNTTVPCVLIRGTSVAHPTHGESHRHVVMDICPYGIHNASTPSTVGAQLLRVVLVVMVVSGNREQQFQHQGWTQWCQSFMTLWDVALQLAFSRTTMSQSQMEYSLSAVAPTQGCAKA